MNAPAVVGHLIQMVVAAVVDMVEDKENNMTQEETVFVVCDSKKPMISDAYDNPVDACYEMILKLNEQKLL